MTRMVIIRQGDQWITYTDPQRTEEALKAMREGRPLPPPLKQEITPPRPEPQQPVTPQAEDNNDTFDLPPVPEVVQTTLKQLTDNHPVPYDLMLRLAASESGLDIDAKSGAGARGFLQLMPATQLQLMYEHKDQLSPEAAAIADNVEKYRKNQKAWQKDPENVRPIYGYRIKKGADKQAVYDLAYDLNASITLGREYVASFTERLGQKFHARLGTLVQKIEDGYSDKTMRDFSQRLTAMKEHLTRPLNYADVKTAYVFGPSGGARFLTALADPKKHDHRALDYARSATVASNPGLFYADPATRKVPRSVKWVYDHFVSKVGNDPLPGEMQPEHTRAPAQQVAQAPDLTQ
ncbi:MAG: transglycosylase SLT domain-containing protein [Rhodospirillales bacterium]|nr:transglycosylase SLT domain-containing protein [Rhodospirillales bacterium]MCB9995053.1 transglycosylase SLT domain-containing protein [Rhodospirillales bacterium]